jgi:hypothetical protein
MEVKNVADIPIQPKRGSSIWLWIIGVIVVILVLWLVFGRGRSNPSAPDVTDTTKTSSLMQYGQRPRSGFAEEAGNHFYWS